MAKQKFYPARNGREGSKVYHSWYECEKQTKGYPGEEHNSFDTLGEAVRWIEAGKTATTPKPPLLIRPLFPEEKGICVWAKFKGAANGAIINAVKLEGRKILVNADMDVETADVAEFIALVESLKYCKGEGLSGKVYSNSDLALGWVKNYGSGAINVADISVMDMGLAHQAVDWLRANRLHNYCEKWDTVKWGEMATWFEDAVE